MNPDLIKGTPENAQGIYKMALDTMMQPDFTFTKLRVATLLKDVILLMEKLGDASTGLKDRAGRDIKVGNVVHWSDGGDELSLEERIKTRWDRIAVVRKDPDIKFEVIDSPSAEVKNWRQRWGGDEDFGMVFHYGNFIYKNTRKYLTVVAESVDDYNAKFKSPGMTMAWVLENVGKLKGNENE